MRLNLDDPMIYTMANNNHTPTETWNHGTGDVLVRCRTCGQDWPCPTRMAIREHQGEAGAVEELDW